MADELICACRKRRAGGFDLDASLRIGLFESPVSVLFGPSGAGKTTLMRLLAGLEEPDSGAIRFRGETWYDSARGLCLPPQRRRAGFLFQDYALFPHLTVAANVAYAARPEKARAAMETFGIADLAARRPRELSGGQQQRVALARALAAEPALLLLDEPLSALDAPARARMRQDLRHMLRDSGVPSVVVTHDRVEALALGDRMAVMLDGRVAQEGPVQEVFRRPAGAAVAEAVGMENVIPAAVAAREAGLATVRVGQAQLQALDTEREPRWACIRAEDIAVARHAPEGSSVRNLLAGRV
ncbi:MAG TPA: ABC transporter ATP-binding protein, partial [Bryobacteraceae bacterium]|nr:ABC transporter ATP-binding protein [Bryobacteraceae bacterium]